MSDSVLESIVGDVKSRDVPWFTILADVTKSKRDNENFVTEIHYVKGGKTYESALWLKATAELDAQFLVDLILNILKKNWLNSDHMLSQRYDRASVLCGDGFQAIIQHQQNWSIPYVHCWNHRLYLVVAKAIHDSLVIKQFFDQCFMLYMFLNL